MKRCYGILLTLVLISAAALAQTPSKLYPFSLDFKPEKTILQAIPAPPGYERFPSAKMNVFMAWITNLPLRPFSNPVVRWDKQILMKADSISGVIDVGVISTNQKDADLPLQLAMEFLRVAGALADFPIILRPADTVNFGKWLNGKYTTGGKDRLNYTPGEKREISETEFYRYLEFVMRRMENKNLLLNLAAVNEKDIHPGDLFIQFRKGDADSIGHAAMIFDVALNKEGDVMLLAGWGGIPARNFAIYRPLPISERKWFTLDEMKAYLAEFGDGRFYRFKYIQ